MNKLSPNEIEEFRDTFKQFDRDGDGTICTTELKDMMNKFGGVTYTDEQIQSIMETADKDGNNRIDFEEFLTLMVHSEPNIEEELHMAFSSMDKDNSGSISAAELKQVMKTLGETLEDEEIDEMIREIDLDGDGQIDYSEFAKIMLEKNKCK